MPIGAAIGGAVATVGGAVIGSNATKKAAKQANQSQQQATQTQLQLGRESMGLSRNIYNANYDTLAPFVGYGMEGAKALNALLGLPQPQPMRSPLAQQQQPGAAPQFGNTLANPAGVGGVGGSSAPQSHPWAAAMSQMPNLGQAR